MGNRVSRKLSEKRNSKKKEQKRRLSSNSTVNQSVPCVSTPNTPKTSKKSQVSEDKIQRLFESYADVSDSIGPEGILRFCEDLEVDPEHISVLLLAWHFKARTMCYFSHSEFVSGMKSLNCDSIPKLKVKMKSFSDSLYDEKTFKEVYEFVFLWSLETPETRILDIETASEMLRLLFNASNTESPFVEQFCTFLNSQKEYKAINKDQWNNFLEFCITSKTDLSDYDECGSWPLMMDEFVEWLRSEYPEQYPVPVDIF